MPREKFQTLTEQMFYILLCLRTECCGIDVMARVEQMTEGRVTIGPGTLYNLLDNFRLSGMIEETGSFGRRRSYILTDRGRQALREEYERMQKQLRDYERCMTEQGGEPQCSKPGAGWNSLPFTTIRASPAIWSGCRRRGG